MYGLSLPDEIRTILTEAALLLEKRDRIMYNRPHVALLLIKMGLAQLQTAPVPVNLDSSSIAEVREVPVTPSAPPRLTVPVQQSRQVAEFIAAHSVQVSDVLTPLVNLYAQYCEWAVAEDRQRLARVQFSKRLVDLGFERRRQGGGAAFFCEVRKPRLV